MTVAVTPRYQNFLGNGTTGPFSFSFPVLLNNYGVPYIVVTKIAANGTKTVLAHPADYSFSAVKLGRQGGIITTTDAIANDGSRLFVEAETPLDQGVEYANQGDFFPETHEGSFDKIHYILMESAKRFAYSISIPATDIITATTTVLPSAPLRANTTLGFGPTGEVLCGSVSTTIVSTPMIPVVQGASLAAARTALEVYSKAEADAAHNLKANLASPTGSGTATWPNLVATTSITLNGSRVWNKMNVRVIDASGTYTPAAGLVFAVVRGVGGGGGGGGSHGDAAGKYGAGGGGGAGGAFEQIYTAAELGASAAVEIGAAGAAGASGAAGGAGGDTTFTPSGTFTNVLTAAGGSGGGEGGNIAGSSWGAGGNAGYQTNGAIPRGSENGSTGLVILGFGAKGGHGGSGPFGRGGFPSGTTGGGDGTGFGAGGAGGTNSGAGAVAGGAGAQGLIVVYEYLSI